MKMSKFIAVVSAITLVCSAALLSSCDDSAGDSLTTSAKTAASSAVTQSESTAKTNGAATTQIIDETLAETEIQTMNTSPEPERTVERTVERATAANTTTSAAPSQTFEQKAYNEYIKLFSRTPSDGKVTVGKSDMYRGLLILVNNTHKFRLDEPEDLQMMTDISNRAFYVSFDELDCDAFTLKEFNLLNRRFLAKYGHKLTVCSGYRTVATQRRNFNASVARVGEKETLKWYTRPGFSEHHTGLAIDYNTDSYGDAAFTGKGDQAYIRQNCEKFGFIHRYTAEKQSITGINPEAWHFRQVGIPHAKYIMNNGLCFEEYVSMLKSYSKSSPLGVKASGKSFDIWYSRGTSAIDVSGYSKYLVSGNNDDGFIITAIK